MKVKEKRSNFYLFTSDRRKLIVELCKRIELLMYDKIFTYK